MIFIDAHAHLYDCFNPAAALRAAATHLTPHGADPAHPIRACALTEAADCRFFQRLENGDLQLSNDWKITSRHPFSLELAAPDGAPLWLIAGRQIKTAERLELSALFFHNIIPDGTPIRDALHRILDANGVPCLNWALGKWLFQRGRLVEELIAEQAAHLLLCDSSMRPIGWPEPRAFAVADLLGVPRLAGSDPLPCPLDETRIGTCGTAIDAPFDPLRPDPSFRQALFAGKETMHRIGRRSSILLALKRQRAYRRSAS